MQNAHGRGALGFESFTRIADAVHDHGIMTLDPAGVIVSWNHGAGHMTGHCAEDIIGQPIALLYPEEARASGRPERELKLALSRGRHEDEGWRVRKDGSLFLASVVTIPLFGDTSEPSGYGCVIRNVSAKRANEEVNRQNEERLRLLLDGARDYAIYMLDPDGHVLSWSKGAELIKGYRAGEVLTKHYGMFFRREDQAEGLPSWQLQRALLHGRTEEEGWRLRKDGSTFWAHVVLTPIYAGDGRHVGFAKVARDMSDRVRLRELTHSLQRMNEFLAVLGHELRNPLAPMKYAVDVLQREGAAGANAGMACEILDRQMAHLTRMLDDLLEAGRLTSGRMTIRPAPIPFGRVVKYAVEAVWSLISARSQTIELDVPEHLWINGDEVRLIQVLQNLLLNAAKFTPERGTIQVCAAVTDERLYVQVSDNGQGMDPATIDRLFLLFAQGKNAAQAPSPGLGIGLALARAIVEMHGGSITATSAGAGKGSVFSFELPGAFFASDREVEEQTTYLGDSPPPLRP